MELAPCGTAAFDDDARFGSTLPADRLTCGEINEVNPRAGRAGEGLNPTRFTVLLFFQVSLHVHARVGASIYDKISHEPKWLRVLFKSLIWISFGNAPVKDFAMLPRQGGHLANAKGP